MDNEMTYLYEQIHKLLTTTVKPGNEAELTINAFKRVFLKDFLPVEIKTEKVPVKRGRGRPRKVEVTVEEGQISGLGALLG